MVAALLMSAACSDDAAQPPPVLEILRDQLPAATAMRPQDIKALIMQNNWSVHSAADQTLGAVLMDFYQIEEMAGDYERATGAEEPTLSEAEKRLREIMHSNQPFVLINRESINVFSCEVSGSDAWGGVAVEVPDGFKCRFDFRARRDGDRWRFVEFTLKNSGIRVTLGEDGKWTAQGLKPDGRANPREGPHDFHVNIRRAGTYTVNGRRIDMPGLAQLFKNRRAVAAYWGPEGRGSTVIYAVTFMCDEELPFVEACNAIKIAWEDGGVREFGLGTMWNRDVVELNFGTLEGARSHAEVRRSADELELWMDGSRAARGDRRAILARLKKCMSDGERVQLTLDGQLPCDVVRRVLLAIESVGVKVKVTPLEEP